MNVIVCNTSATYSDCVVGQERMSVVLRAHRFVLAAGREEMVCPEADKLQ